IAMHEMFPSLPFSIDRDFTPIGLMGELPMMLAVSPSLGVKTLAEVIALSKTRPILYAGNARGTFANLTVGRLRQESGDDFSFVPYPGAAAALQDLLGGRISMMCEAPSAFLGPVQAGSVKLVAVGSPKRLPNFPDVPTIAETIPGFTAMAWLALLAPTGTPEPIIRKVNADLNHVFAQPEIAHRLQEIGTYALVAGRDRRIHQPRAAGLDTGRAAGRDGALTPDANPLISSSPARSARSPV